MINLQLKNLKYRKINAFFDIEDTIQSEIESKFSLHVDYTTDNKKCAATLINNITCPTKADVFDINIELIGYFDCDGIFSNSNKQEAYADIYNLMFPYCQSIVAELTTKGGLTPIMLQRAYEFRTQD